MSAATGVQELETRLTEMLESVQGAGKVQVMITLESAGETVYARDEQSDTQTTQDGSDGVTDRKESYKSEHIIVDAADGKQPLVETHIEPEVKGVARGVRGRGRYYCDKTHYRSGLGCIGAFDQPDMRYKNDLDGGCI